MSDERHIPGFCPMGCGETLFRGSGGYVTCGYLRCPEPTAVSTLLADHETEHIVDLRDAGFAIRHPMRERLRDDLLRCDLHLVLESMDGPPRVLGRYRVYGATGGQGRVWESLLPGVLS